MFSKIEYWLLGVAIALFGAAALGIAGHAHRAALARTPLVVAQQGSAVPDDAALGATLPSGGDVVTLVATSRRVPPPGDPAAVRRQIEDGAPRTYIEDLLRSQGGGLYRWPPPDEGRLHVWIESAPRVPDWWLGNVQLARDAFAEWQMADIPFAFDYPSDSAGADIVIRWMDRYPPGRTTIGQTQRRSDRTGWTMHADILIPLHLDNGVRIEQDELVAILRHEIGHALGLGHSTDTTTIMFPQEVQRTITDRDRATLHLLYTVPAGLVR